MGSRGTVGEDPKSCFGYDKFKMTSDIQEEMARRQLGL